jgi:phage tail tape-measure protein
LGEIWSEISTGRASPVEGFAMLAGADLGVSEPAARRHLRDFYKPRNMMKRALSGARSGFHAPFESQGGFGRALGRASLGGFQAITPMTPTVSATSAIGSSGPGLLETKLLETKFGRLGRGVSKAGGMAFRAFGRVSGPLDTVMRIAQGEAAHKAVAKSAGFFLGFEVGSVVGSAVGGAVTGALEGAAIGGSLGSIAPGVGTVIGIGVGMVAGMAMEATVGKALEFQEFLSKKGRERRKLELGGNISPVELTQEVCLAEKLL